MCSRAPRRSLLLFLLSAGSGVGITYVLYSAVDTLRRLDVVEAERDSWQRPGDVINALDLCEGNVVVDLGSGAGYFALKISPIIGSRGRVLAVDLRKLSLSFLWIRAAYALRDNIRISVGEEDDPHLPTAAVDAVLIANTYHEFRNPQLMLAYAFRALRSGGRLVLVDRGPRPVDRQPRQEVAHGREIPLSAAEKELRDEGFEIVGREERFIDRPGDNLWWLLAARKP